MGIGSELRRAREARGVSLTELSRRTKIALTTLRAIDADDFDRLPGGIFTRGFLKAYAREVGLDAEAVSKQYSIKLDEEAAAAERERIAASAEDATRAPQLEDEGVRASTVLAWLVVATTAFIALDRWQRWDFSERAGTTTASGGEVQPPVATTGMADVESPPPPSQAIRLELQAHGPCWVEARADGKQVLYRLMSARERETIEAREDVVLRVGDPTALELSINGMAAQPLGNAARPVTVRITPDNWKDLLLPMPVS